jgi:hypothetical protein
MNRIHRPASRRATKVAASVATAALTIALTAATGTPAHAGVAAKGNTTDYAFSALAYGTKVLAAAGELRSGRTAPAWIGCTRQAGRDKTNELLAVDAPTGNPLIQLGTITSHSSTYKTPKTIAAGTTSVSKVASVTLGLQNPQVPSPSLSIDALTTTATAWADNHGELHAATNLKVGDISLVVPPTGTPIDGPLAQLLDLVNGTVQPTLQQVLTLLQANSGGIEIPGLGRLESGYQKSGVSGGTASAKALALRVTLFGADGVAGNADDSAIKIGRSFAQVTEKVTVGVMSGAGSAANADLVGGNAHIGDIVAQQLPCLGTDGSTRENFLAGATVPGVTLGDLSGKANGKIYGNGRTRAWTQGSVAHVALGSGDQTVTIDGVVGRVTLSTDKAGRIKRRDTEGTQGGVLSFNGQTFTLPEPGGDLPTLPPELDALISLQVGITDKSDNRGLQVTALRITLLGGSAAGTVINLGNAKASLRKS